MTQTAHQEAEPPPWTREGWLEALNQLLGDGQFDVQELDDAWRAARQREGKAIEVGRTGYTIEVYPGAGVRLPEC